MPIVGKLILGGHPTEWQHARCGLFNSSQAAQRQRSPPIEMGGDRARSEYGAEEERACWAWAYAACQHHGTEQDDTQTRMHETVGCVCVVGGDNHKT